MSIRVNERTRPVATPARIASYRGGSGDRLAAAADIGVQLHGANHTNALIGIAWGGHVYIGQDDVHVAAVAWLVREAKKLFNRHGARMNLGHQGITRFVSGTTYRITGKMIAGPGVSDPSNPYAGLGFPRPTWQPIISAESQSAVHDVRPINVGRGWGAFQL